MDDKSLPMMEQSDKLKELEDNILRLEKAILLIANWTNFDLEILKHQGLELKQTEVPDHLSARQLSKKKGSNCRDKKRTIRTPNSRNSKRIQHNGRRLVHQVARKSTGLAPNTRRLQWEEKIFKPACNTLKEEEAEDPLRITEEDAASLGCKSEEDDEDYVPPNQNCDENFMELSDSEEENFSGPESSESTDPLMCKIINVKSMANPNPYVHLNKFSQQLLKKYNLIGKIKTKPKVKRRPRPPTSGSGRSVVKDPYTCSDCPEVFKYKAELKKHFAKIHKVKVKKVYHCEYCGKSSRWKEKHFDHVRTHTGEKPFLCSDCGHVSRTLQSLTEHIKIHTDERNFACDQCSLMFRRPSDVKRHKKKVHNINNDLLRPCPQCKAVFSDQCKLKRHINDIHEEKRTLECPICSQGFKRKEHLRMHILRHDNPHRRKRGPQKPMPKKLPPPQLEMEDVEVTSETFGVGTKEDIPEPAGVQEKLELALKADGTDPSDSVAPDNFDKSETRVDMDPTLELLVTKEGTGEYIDFRMKLLD